MKDTLTVAGKELHSFYSDKVVLAQLLLMPFAIVCGFFLLISAMGGEAATATAEEGRQLLGMIVPVIMLMASFMSCMNLAAETVAGDKERGFLPLLLIVPVRRVSIAAGKSLSLLAAAAVSAVSAFLGMVAALPKLSEALSLSETLSLTFGEYILLFSANLTAVVALTGMLLILSTLAKDVRQAVNIAPAIIMILMIGGMMTTSDAFRQTIDSLGLWNSAIPAWNSLLLMGEVVSRTHTAAELLLTCGSNLLFAVLAAGIVGLCFTQEQIICR